MCAQFLIKIHVKKLAAYLQLPLLFEQDLIEGRFLPYGQAPVILRESENYVLRQMNFSLIPSWSDSAKVKFATHNARLDAILDKPTWKEPFVKSRVVVPMTEFVEPIKVPGKKYAGNMVRFLEKNERPLLAAGFSSTWIDRSTGQVLESFAIITDNAPDFVADTGHDRCPVFITAKSVPEWLDPGKKTPDLMTLLNQERDSIDFDVQIDRPLKAGWDKKSI